MTTGIRKTNIPTSTQNNPKTRSSATALVPPSSGQRANLTRSSYEKKTAVFHVPSSKHTDQMQYYAIPSHFWRTTAFQCRRLANGLCCSARKLTIFIFCVPLWNRLAHAGVESCCGGSVSINNARGKWMKFFFYIHSFVFIFYYVFVVKVWHDIRCLFENVHINVRDRILSFEIIFCDYSASGNGFYFYNFLCNVFVFYSRRIHAGFTCFF